MKVQYLGTAAAERIPGMFCNCEVCRRALALGGKNIMTQAQVLIEAGTAENGKLLYVVTLTEDAPDAGAYAEARESDMKCCCTVCAGDCHLST